MDIRTDVPWLWCDDITFCQEQCGWKSCPRNKQNIRDRTIPHSFSVEIPSDCPKQDRHLNDETAVIEYTSPNGFRGVLYGKSSMSIYDADGEEVLHSGKRTPNTLEELIPIVDGMPGFLKMLYGK